MEQTMKAKKIVMFMYQTLIMAILFIAAIKLLLNDGSWVNYFIISLCGLALLAVFRLVKNKIMGN